MTNENCTRIRLVSRVNEITARDNFRWLRHYHRSFDFRCQLSTVKKTSQVNMAVWSTFLRSSARNVQLLKSINTPIATKLTQNGTWIDVFNLRVADFSKFHFVQSPDHPMNCVNIL